VRSIFNELSRCNWEELKRRKIIAIKITKPTIIFLLR